MTDSCHCFKALLLVTVLAFLPALLLPAAGQSSVWNLPETGQKTAIYSLGGGTSTARETYLSESSYSGWSVSALADSWTSRKAGSLFGYGKSHSDILFSSMTNSLGGGSTWQLMGNYSYAFEWMAVNTPSSDLLLGPVAMMNIGCLYNRSNSNNPATAEGYLALGLCMDYTLRYTIRQYPMALQNSLYVPLAGVGFAPDYDQPYWHMYRYKQYDRALHFLWLGNNLALREQIAVVFPIMGGRFRVAADLDIYRNHVGGHLRRISHSSAELGYIFTFEQKRWRL